MCFIKQKSPSKKVEPHNFYWFSKDLGFTDLVEDDVQPYRQIHPTLFEEHVRSLDNMRISNLALFINAGVSKMNIIS